MSVLYCQSPALFWCALALIVCFFVRRGAHRVRAVLDLVLGLLCIVGGVALYYLGMYNDAFTIRDFWQIRTAGWIGLAAVVLLTAWQVIKATRRSVSVRRAARQAELEEQAHRQELEEARSRARDMLYRLNLPERLWNLAPATFSGGEQQRVNIARGMIRPTPVLLLDEPTASLDGENRRVVIDLIREAKAAGTAIIGIFHDDAAREAVATRCLNMARA